VCPYYGPKVVRLSLEEEPDPGDTVQDQAEKDQGQCPSSGKVFGNGVQGIPEIQESFLGIHVGEGGPPQMVDVALAHIIDFVPCILGPPAKVDLLLVGEIVLIKALELPKDGTFDEHAGPCGPKDFPDIVVLAAVPFQGLEDPSPAEGIAEHVHKAPGGPGILKVVPFQKVQDLGLDDGGPWPFDKSFPYGFQPIGADLHIGVQQAKDIRLYGPQPIVIAFGKSPVDRVLDPVDLGVMFLEEGDGPIRTGVVHHVDVSALGMGHHRGKEALQQGLPVPIEYDDGYFQIAGKLTAKIRNFP